MVAPYVPNPADWPHQSYAVTEAVNQSNEGWRRFCITSPTGGGKSRITQRLCEHWQKHGETSIVLSNRKLLTNQLLTGLTKSGLEVGCRAAGFESWTNLRALTQILSSQTERSRVFRRREKYGDDIQLHPGTLLIVDEAHMNKGPEAVKLIMEYATKYDAVVVLISATPLGISHLGPDGLIVAGNNTQLRECGALVWANQFEPRVMDLSQVYKKKTGVLSQAEADKAAKYIWTQSIVANVYDSWKKLNPNARPSIGMAPGVKESLGLAQEYWNRGVNAAHIDSGGIFVNGSYKKTTDHPVTESMIFIFLRSLRISKLEYLFFTIPCLPSYTSFPVESVNQFSNVLLTGVITTPFSSFRSSKGTWLVLTSVTVKFISVTLKLPLK